MPTRHPARGTCGAGRRGFAQPHVAARLDQRTRDTALLQHRQRLVHRVALGDAAEVDAHPRLEQFDGFLLWIEPDVLVTDQLAGLFQGFGRR